MHVRGLPIRRDNGIQLLAHQGIEVVYGRSVLVKSTCCVHAADLTEMESIQPKVIVSWFCYSENCTR